MSHASHFVLFFQEASHLQSVSPLPADITSKACMLLIVNLSSPGMIGDRRHGRRRHLHPAATKSHIYNTLVAWFLSLVSEMWLFSANTCYLKSWVHASPFKGHLLMFIRLAQTHVTLKTRLVQRSHSGLQDFSSCGQKMDWLCML